MAEVLSEAGDKLAEYDTAIGKIEGLADNFSNASARKKITEGKTACAELKEKIGALLKDPDVKAATSSDADIKKDWRDKSVQFNKLSGRHQKAITKIGKLEKEHTAAKRGTPDQKDLDREGTGDDDGPQQQVQKQLNVKKLQAMNCDMMLVDEQIQAEKAQEIREIEEGVNEVAACYTEFGNIVKEQQEGLDIAEANIVKTRENVQSGTEEIKKAREYQKSSRKYYICACVALVVILGVAVVIGVVAS